MKLSFYSTPGHGYLRVPKSTFLKVGADPNEISKSSGHDETTLYLEEDDDAGYFLNFLKENEIPFDIKSIYKDRFSITHNYNPSLFHLKLREGVSVKLCNECSATLGFFNGTQLVARTTNGAVYRIPKSNPFKYIVEKV